MSLIDLASLVLAPTATKEGKVYSAIPDTGEGDMTFTRGSSATRVNSAGLIEKERANLLLQSNTFDTTWVSSNTTETGGQSGYDGSSDAWLLSKTSGYANLNQSVSASGVNTYSVYAKANTLNWLRIVGGSTSAFFDLNNGVVGSTDAGNIAKMTSIGSGWYRCEVAMNASTTIMRIYPAQADNDVSGTSGSILIQDAMLNQGLVAQSYIETTTSAVYEGITDDVPRVDYSGGGCPSLLLESQRSNLLPQSEYFGAWNNARTIDTNNQAISPEGLFNAAYLEQQSGQTNAGSLYLGLTFPSTGDYTTSIFAKKGEKDFIVAYDKNTNRTYFNLDTGTVGTTPAGVTASIKDFGNGWYRCSATFNTAAGGSNIAWYLGDTDNSSTVTDSGGVYIYGAMLEAGSYVSSYIPTYSVSSTRVADSCSKTGISELIGQTEGTMFCEMGEDVNFGTVTTSIFCLDDNTANNRIELSITPTGNGRISFYISNGGTEQVNILSVSTLSANDKIAVTYKANDFVVYLNGTAIDTDTSGSVPTTNVARIAQRYDGGRTEKNSFKQAILFPTRLTNDQLEEITK